MKSPPKHYTEDSLLAAMETAGAGDMPEDAERKGLGTPATRAATLEKLVSAGFVQRKKKQLIPTEKGVSLLIDCGANVDARPAHLLQFAKMGSIYMENVLGIKDPKVGIVNIGAEEEKGNALVKDTFPQLKELPGINFIGSVEARDIPQGVCDVIVCEAFVGNVILKLYEGVGATLISKVKQGMMTSLRSKIGALLVTCIERNAQIF